MCLLKISLPGPLYAPRVHLIVLGLCFSLGGNNILLYRGAPDSAVIAAGHFAVCCT